MEIVNKLVSLEIKILLSCDQAVNKRLQNINGYTLFCNGMTEPIDYLYNINNFSLFS